MSLFVDLFGCKAQNLFWAGVYTQPAALAVVGVEKEDYILDPFNGSGTVTLTAAVKGISAVGIEVNPFAAFMASATLTSSIKALSMSAQVSV